MARDSSIIFITGGVRSGKSQFAEELAAEIWHQEASGGLHYIASMQASDKEMTKRIARHQEGRRQSGLEWHTWEKPMSIGELAPSFHGNEFVLFDCLTTWLNNELFFSPDGWQDEEFLASLSAKMLEGIAMIAKRVRALIIVSNEVLHEPLGDNELIITYSKLLGKLHQSIVKDCREAYLVDMGIPLQMKGVRQCVE